MISKTITMISAILLTSVATPSLAKDITVSHFNNLTDRSIVAAGDYAWNDMDYIPGKVTVSVNLSTQMAYVKRGDTLIGITNISSGRAGYETPTGTFAILGKEDNHWSRKYKADMPYTMWVTGDGVALHSGSTPGRTTSHGCIHLPHGFAALLYQVVDKGASVQITANLPTDNLRLKL